MDTITIIEYLIIFMIAYYLTGLAILWGYEFKRNALHNQMKKEVKVLELSYLSTALQNVKKYKITQDYYRKISGLEMVQQFIIKKVLLMKNMHNSLSPSYLSPRRTVR